MPRKQFYLKVILQDEVVEDQREFPFFKGKEQTDLQSVLKTIESARTNQRIRSLILILKNVTIGWGQVEELHHELRRFDESGKRSLAFLETATNQSYYLACGTQEIYLSPATHLELVGLRAEVLFLKNLLNYLGIEGQLFGLGEFKSATEMFTRREMSEANRRMTDWILTDLQERFKQKIAEHRSVSHEQVQKWIDSGPYTASQAVKKGLVDGICYEDELEQILQRDASYLMEYPASKLPFRDGRLKRTLTFYRPQIAYIVAEGLITLGQSRRVRDKHTLLGSDTLVSLLRDARKRKRVKAVVLRINSPGGSALAADLIWREIKITNRKKPVIVSFGNVAASGGYYIAMAARKVVSLPSTLTGSIGVIQGKVNLQGFLSKVGITIDSVDKGKRSGFFSTLQPFSNEEIDIVKGQMREFYEELFLKKVAESRQQPIEAIRGLAEGRVWTGAQAAKQGLLDSIGGVSQAIEIARLEAGIPENKKIRIVRYSKRFSLRDVLSFPLLETFPANQLLVLMQEELLIR